MAGGARQVAGGAGAAGRVERRAQGGPQGVISRRAEGGLVWG